MAEGYARATGKVGVVLVTSGPGATNAVTGIANAYMDSTPLVVFTGQVPRKLIGSDAFQEIDTVGITMPCTKYNYLARNACDLAEIVKEAIYKVGVVLVTSGPGATNAVTGIANAYMDSTPLVVFTGQVPRKLIGSDAFQEIDTVGITMPCTKYNYLARNACDLAEIVKEAFYIAGTGRPGPVLIDIPKDVANEKAPFIYPERVRLPGYRPSVLADPGQVQRAMAKIGTAKR